MMSIQTIFKQYKVGLVASALLLACSGAQSGAIDAPAPRPSVTRTIEEMVEESRTPKPNATPQSIYIDTETPTPLSTAILIPTPVATDTPIPEPVPIDQSVCQLEDIAGEGVKYVSPGIGVKIRDEPLLESSYNGGAPQNTELNVICQRTIGDMDWYNVEYNGNNFWVPEIWVSNDLIAPTNNRISPTDPEAVSPSITPGDGNKIILTFDDSGKYANDILDILGQYDAKAIFFPTGNWAHGNPVVQRMYDEGHLVCNHTYSHPYLTELSAEEISSQILGGAGVGSCNLLRPPYGSHNGLVDSIAEDLGFSIYMWSIDTRDWARRYPGGDQEILNIVLDQAFPGAVVLMHMHVPNTIDALPDMLEGLQAASYELHW